MISTSTVTNVLEFARQRDWDQFHSPENLAKSISIEAAELLECFQWSTEFNQKDVAMELADIVTYCILMANKIGANLDEIVSEKLRISAEKYPLDKARGRATRYDQL